MENYSKIESHSHYSELPNIPCPRHLFVSLLSKKYLTALYLVEPSIFPQNWSLLIKMNPLGAWSTLNELVIQYLSSRYSSQGLQFGNCETAISTLAQKISENICTDIRNYERDTTKNERAIKPKDGEFDLLAEKLQIVFDLVSSELVKLTERDVIIQIVIDGKAIHITK